MYQCHGAVRKGPVAQPGSSGKEVYDWWELVGNSSKSWKQLTFNLWKSEFLRKEINLMIVNGMISCLYMAHTRIIDIGYFLRWKEECLDFSSWKTSRRAKYTVTDKCIHILFFFLFFEYQVYCKTFRIMIMSWHFVQSLKRALHSYFSL